LSARLLSRSGEQRGWHAIVVHGFVAAELHLVDAADRSIPARLCA
jgi:hypothetical protein